MSNQEEVCQPEVLAGEWGGRFIAAREAQNLSLDSAAKNLNLPAEYLRLLELGQLEGLPSMVFAKGYIRSYAKLLHLDDNTLIADYEELHGQGGKKDQIRPVSKVRQQVKMSDPVMRVSTWVFIIAIVGLSVWWWQTQNNFVPSFSLGGSESGTESSSATADESSNVVVAEDGTAQLKLPTIDDAAPSEESAESTDAEEAPRAESEASPADEEAGDEQANTDQADSQEAEPQYLSADEIKKLQSKIDSQSIDQQAQEALIEDASDTGDAASETAVELSTNNEAPVVAADFSEARLDIDFINECWVSIKDANGKTLFNNLRGSGQSVNVTGKAPVTILIGAANAVSRFSFNGKEIDLNQHSRKNIVRLTLPLAE